MAHMLRHLPPTSETWIEFLAPDSDPVQTWLLWTFRERSSGWKITFSSLFFLCLRVSNKKCFLMFKSNTGNSYPSILPHFFLRERKALSKETCTPDPTGVNRLCGLGQAHELWPRGTPLRRGASSSLHLTPTCSLGRGR